MRFLEALPLENQRNKGNIAVGNDQKVNDDFKCLYPLPANNKPKDDSQKCDAKS